MPVRIARTAVVVCCAWLAVAAGPTTIPIKNLYVLGDSLSDQGNLFLATAMAGPAYGSPPLPASDHYVNGRFSNGESYAGVLAALFGLELEPSLAGGNNYAFGGARTTYNRVEAPIGPFPVGLFPWSLDGQRQAFLQDVRDKGADPTTLYVVFSGANDIGDILSRGLNPATTILNTVEGIRQVILTFESVGARNIFVPNVPNLGLVPGITVFGPAVSALATGLTASYNAALATMLDEVSAAFPHLNIIPFDTFALTTDIITNPSAYGLTNATQPCYSGFVTPNPLGTECSTPDTYAFWDTEHPTRVLHAILADSMFAALGCEVPGKGDAPVKCALNQNAH